MDGPLVWWTAIIQLVAGVCGFAASGSMYKKRLPVQIGGKKEEDVNTGIDPEVRDGLEDSPYIAMKC